MTTAIAVGSRTRRARAWSRSAMIMPLFILIVLGVVEVGYALLDQHVVTRMSREGSNLISRDTTLQDAATVLRDMTSRPVNFNNGSSKLIFSVLKRGETTGTSQLRPDHPVSAPRVRHLPGPSKLLTAGGGSFGPAPDYQAVNSDSNTGLRVTNVPGQSRGGERRADLRDGDLHEARPDHPARPVRDQRAADPVLDRVLLIPGIAEGAERQLTMTENDSIYPARRASP